MAPTRSVAARNGSSGNCRFPTRRHVSAASASASKSGLLFRMEGGLGFVGFHPSPLLEEVSELADFRDALRKEADAMEG